MNNAQKAAYLYEEALRYKSAGHTLVASELIKVADFHGRLYVKEALSYGKKVEKRADIEKPLTSSKPHEGLKKKAQGQYKSALDWASIGKNYVLPAAKATGKYLGIGAATTAGAAGVANYAVPYIAGNVVENSSSGIMDTMGKKLKEYAVPAGIALAATGAAAFGFGNTRGKLTAHEEGLPSRRVAVPRRNKVAKIIAASRIREKIASAYGEDSPYVRDCDTAIARIIFEVDHAS